YPIEQALDPERYRLVGTWLGRLILPPLDQRAVVNGVLFEVYHTDADHTNLVGQVVYLRWEAEGEAQKAYVSAIRDVQFNAAAKKSVMAGNIHPTRLDGWPLATPLESLAGARSNDDVVVRLDGEVMVGVADNGTTVLSIGRAPVQISGRYYGLVKIIGPTKA